MNIEADFNYRKPLKENEAKPAYGLEEPNEDANVLPEYLQAFKKTVQYTMLENLISTSRWGVLSSLIMSLR